MGGPVDFGEFLGSITTVDLLLILYFMGFFVLGFAQGTIRRLIGIGAILFSFFFAANVAAPLGDFLGANWTQFAKEYSYMVGFMTVFVAAALAFAIVVQGFYRPAPLFEKARFVDELLGGVLGVVQAGLILACIYIILGTFFLIPGIAPDPQELPILREVWDGLAGSRIMDVFHDTLIPVFLGLTGFLVPDTIEVLFPSGGTTPAAG